jgi:hypothetical protein
MSPSRTRKAVVHTRDRSEVVIAAVVGVGLVLATIALIWLMRPGPAGVPGGGGLFNRQPRVTWLFLLSIGIGVAGTFWVLRGRHRPRRFSGLVSVILVWVVVVLGATLVAIFWPDGILRHYISLPKPLKVNETPTTTPTPTAQVTPTTTATPTTKGSPTTAAP